MPLTRRPETGCIRIRSYTASRSADARSDFCHMFDSRRPSQGEETISAMAWRGVRGIISSPARSAAEDGRLPRVSPRRSTRSSLTLDRVTTQCRTAAETESACCASFSPRRPVGRTRRNTDPDRAFLRAEARWGTRCHAGRRRGSGPVSPTKRSKTCGCCPNFKEAGVL